MSRIGKQPVVLPSNVKASVQGQKLSLEGPKGKLSTQVHSSVSVKVEDGKIICSISDKANAQSRALHGLARSLIANMVEGCSTAFRKELEINGVGFRANVKGRILEMSLGYSHPVNFNIPEGITVTVDKLTKIILEGPDKQILGQTAAEIRSIRPPEPYKGKGVKYVTEVIRRKAGKSAATGAA